MGERGGTGEVASSARAPSPQMSAVSRVSEPAWSGGEGEPESESRTQMPESKLRLDWLPPPPPVLAGPEPEPDRPAGPKLKIVGGASPTYYSGLPCSRRDRIQSRLDL